MAVKIAANHHGAESAVLSQSVIAPKIVVVMPTARDRSTFLGLTGGVLHQ